MVLYPADLPPEQVQHKAFVTGPKGRGVLAGADPEADVVTATNVQQTLTCSDVRVAKLGSFTTKWLDSISS